MYRLKRQGTRDKGQGNFASLHFVFTLVTRLRPSSLMFLFFLSSCICNAQAELNFKTVEDSTYSLYLKKDWKQLQKFGRLAIKNKIDYFYLRERLGIAYYEQKKYQLAVPQFEKAMKLNSYDELLQEYLFYGYAFDNRYDEALHFSKKFSKELQVKTNATKPAPINLAQLDFTVKMPDNSNLAMPYYFFGLGFNHRITKGYSVFHAYSFSRQKYAIAGLRNTEGIYDQHRYYMSTNIPLGKGFLLNTGFSFLVDQYKDTIFYPLPPPPHRPPPPQPRTRNYLSFIGSLNVSKIFPYAKLDLTNAFSNLDTTYQLEHTLGATVYPLANRKLSIGGAFILYTSDYYKTLHPLFQAGMHFNAPQFFAMSIVYTYANVYNFHLYNGYLVQNGYDLLKGKITAMPEFIIKQRYSIFAAYQFEMKKTRETGINYFAHGISIGTKLKF